MNINMKDEASNNRSNVDLVAGVLVGIGLAMGSVPILIASLLVRQNLFLVIWNRMDEFWRARGWD